MSILVYTESENGKFKKASFEAASYAKALAEKNGDSVTAVCIHADNPESLGEYGVDRVLNITGEKLKKFNAEAYADAIAQATKKAEAKVVVMSQTANDKYLAPILAIDLEAGYAPDVVALPESTDPFRVKRPAFTNKGFTIYFGNHHSTLFGKANNVVYIATICHIFITFKTSTNKTFLSVYIEFGVTYDYFSSFNIVKNFNLC
jgi:electron transfer flavoprotein alpha subunit